MPNRNSRPQKIRLRASIRRVVFRNATSLQKNPSLTPVQVDKKNSGKPSPASANDVEGSTRSTYAWDDCTSEALEGDADASVKRNKFEDKQRNALPQEKREERATSVSSSYAATVPSKKRTVANALAPGAPPEVAARPVKRRKTAKPSWAPWDQRLEELKKFKKKHGHCRIPATSASIYYWLKKQKVYLNPDSPASLINVAERERRKKKLESILESDLLYRGKHRSAEVTRWDERLDELKRFKLANGHCRVTRSLDGPLRSWLTNQRYVFLNPYSPKYLQDRAERERRQKELETTLDIEARKKAHAYPK